ncbi:MAG: two-component sensor histidine kinase, partial [Bifidobacterium longum]|nr:two-component sensor histidine kinase [Bifidobacterium longum]
MRVLAEMGLLLVLGLALAWLVGVRLDGVFIAGLLLAVSVAGLVEWLRPAQWSWVLCTAYLVIAVAVPSWCAFMPLIAYDTAQLPALASTGARTGARTAASSRSPSVSRTAASRRSLADAIRSAPWLSVAARWIWVLPPIALWFARGTDRPQTLVMTMVALLGFVLGRARASSDEARRALLHAQDRARESSRATRSRIADIDEERA